MMIEQLDSRIRIVNGKRLYKVDFNSDNSYGGFSVDTVIINNEAYDIKFCSWGNAILKIVEKLHNKQSKQEYLNLMYNDTYNAFGEKEVINTKHCDINDLYLNTNNVTPRMFINCIKGLIDLYKINQDQLIIYCHVKHSEEKSEVLDYIRNINKVNFENYVKANNSAKNADIILKNVENVNNCYKLDKVPNNQVARGMNHKLVKNDLLCYDNYRDFSNEYSYIEKSIKNIVPAGPRQTVAIAVLKQLREYYKTNPSIY